MAGAVWVVDTAGSLVEVDPATARVVRRQPLGVPPSHVDAGGGAVLVASYCAGALVRYEPVTDELHRAQVEQASDVAVASDAVWVNHGSNATAYDC